MDKKGESKLKTEIVSAIGTVYDPEIPVNIYELGLIYEINVDEQGKVEIKMTLTSPSCPAAESIPVEVESKVKSLNNVSEVDVEIIWDPPWTPDMMSEAAKLELGML